MKKDCTKKCPVTGLPLKDDGTPDLSSMFVSRKVIDGVAEVNRKLTCKVLKYERQLEKMREVLK